MKTTAAILFSALFAVSSSAPLNKPRQSTDFQTFTGALGGITATPILDSGDNIRPFKVKADTFVNLAGAVQRSCDQQFNACANAANGGDQTLSLAACSDQQTQCNAAGQSASASTASTSSQASSSASTTTASASSGKACSAKKRRSVRKPAQRS